MKIGPIYKIYKDGNQEFCIDVPVLDFPAGKIVYIVGINGCGKSLLLSAVSEAIFGIHGSEAVFVLQNSKDNIAGSLTALESVAVWARPRGLRDLFFPTKKCDNFVRQVEAVFPSLRGIWNQQVATLSGGQKQLLSLLARLQGEPHTVLLDETFSAMDEATSYGAELYFRDYVSKSNCHAAIVSHRIPSIVNNADFILIISRGRLKKLIDANFYSKSEVDLMLRKHFMDVDG